MSVGSHVHVSRLDTGGVENDSEYLLNEGGYENRTAGDMLSRGNLSAKAGIILVSDFFFTNSALKFSRNHRASKTSSLLFRNFSLQVSLLSFSPSSILRMTYCPIMGLLYMRLSLM